jgi:hypothetical protein
LPRVFQDEIENALVVLPAKRAALRRFRGNAIGKEAFKYQARIDFRGQRSGFALPGKIELVGATVTRVASARLLPLVTAQLERGEAGQLAQPRRRHLIHRNARANIHRSSFAGLCPRQKRR